MLKCYPNSNAIKDVLLRGNYISRKPIYDFLGNIACECGGVILDLGCGNMPYKPLFQNIGQYIGLDVPTAKEYGYHGDDIVYYNGRDIPFDENSIDNVISIQVFEHIKDIDYTLNEVYRVLKPGGRLYCSVPMANVIHYIPYDFRRFTNYGLIDLLKKHGFSNIRIEGSNRLIDTIRFLRLGALNRYIRWIYSWYANMAYLYGRSRFKKKMVAIENILRRKLGRIDKKIDLEVFPVMYFVKCEKDAL